MDRKGTLGSTSKILSSMVKNKKKEVDSKENTDDKVGQNHPKPKIGGSRVRKHNKEELLQNLLNQTLDKKNTPMGE